MAELIRIRATANPRDSIKMADIKVAICRWAAWLEARDTYFYITTLN